MKENEEFGKKGIDFCNKLEKNLKLNNYLFQINRKIMVNIEEIFIIIERIEENVNKINNIINKMIVSSKGQPIVFIKRDFSNRIIGLVEGREIIKNSIKARTNINKEGIEFFYFHHSLALDIKSLMVCKRELMDYFARLINLTKGKNKSPISMGQLLKDMDKKKYRDLDNKFFTDLENELSWFLEFKEDRDGVLHKLQEIPKGSKSITQLINFSLNYSKERVNKLSSFIDFLDKELIS